MISSSAKDSMKRKRTSASSMLAEPVDHDPHSKRTYAPDRQDVEPLLLDDAELECCEDVPMAVEGDVAMTSDEKIEGPNSFQV